MKSIPNYAKLGYFEAMDTLVEEPATELGSMIVRTPDIIGGKPRVKGHRIGVHRVAGWWKQGLTIDEIGEHLSSLAPAEIFAALAYYFLHKEEIDRYLREERETCDLLAKQIAGT